MAIRGITVTLIQLTTTGFNDYGEPVQTEESIPVENVLVTPISDAEAVEIYNLEGKKAVYQLAIPKGDQHSWENNYVEFFGKRWKVIGPVIQGIEELIPLSWNKKVRVERYE